ncbi:MAG: formate--tetrahydrofolate ligase [SAR324 cluster bacterium]|nr:formate--tetrahydrofolate ligase [SAR324 cluster bacterium]
MPDQPSDIEIAQAAAIRPIGEIAERAGIPPDALLLYGAHKAKLNLSFCREARARPPGKLILVTAMTPTPAGEGKTTTAVGLADGLVRLGHRAAVCLREPSLGPVFGAKGGAAGGGYAQVIPMEEINLHFTGDFHAIGAAHNLLAALIDNHLHQGNALGISPYSVSLGRVLDLSDRALRHVVTGLGGRTDGVPRESWFDITPASEVMAIFCLARDLDDLQKRLGRMVVAEDRAGDPVRVTALGADGSLAVLLKDALAPNLVQTLEGTPALVHGGPFANIAHGCNSVLATTTALGLGGYVVTEAGFGSDLGAEKFVNIKCRIAGLQPAAVTLVATLRALKLHGGAERNAHDAPDSAAIEAGFANLKRHIANVRGFGLPLVVALNRFAGDRDEEVEQVRRLCEAEGAPMASCEAWSGGGAGAEALAEAIVQAAEGGGAPPRFTYPDDLPLWDKAERIAQTVYGAECLESLGRVRAKFDRLEAQGFGGLPVCIAKTQASLTADPKRLGAPTGFRVPVRDVRLAAGAGFVVVLTGDVLTMPGLPQSPAAERIGLNPDGSVYGLF